jgi:hypothetical protein
MGNVNSSFSKAARGMAIAAIAAGIVATPAVNGKPKPKTTVGEDGFQIIRVSPMELPEPARQSGQAMLLHETGDGRTFLYIEQNQGAQLAVFDVSDPGDIKAQGVVQLQAAGAFDFVSAAGEHAEILRFRDGQGEAWLDLHKAKAPIVRTGPTPKSRMALASVDADGNLVATHSNAPSVQDHRAGKTSNTQESNSVAASNNTGEQVTNPSTGTTFLLTTDGLHVIRRPSMELEYAAHQDQLSNPG